MTPENTALGFVDDLARGSDPQFRALEAAAGRFFEVRSATRAGSAVDVVCVFEHTVKTLHVVFDAHGAVAQWTWAASPDELEARTRAVLEHARQGDFVAAETAFGPKMREVLPPDKLSAAWRALEAEAGRFRAVTEVRFENASAGVMRATAVASFERTKLLVRVAFDAGDAIVGLVFAPEQPWSPPSYAKPDAVVETDVTVGEDPALPGELTLPKGEGRVPAVVLVHGSGPGDRDESIGGVRVFKDLALGLAARGVGVLRYDKRTRVLPTGVVTEKEEAIDPALAAIDLLAKNPRVGRIFLVGHSQGGTLAPRIAAAAPNLAGYVVMAGATRPLADVIIDQYEYFASLHPENEAFKKKIEEAYAFKRAIEDPALKPTDRPTSPFGVVATGAYFLYQRGYDPVATAKSLGRPLLVLQGGRDYQVTRKDLDRWKDGLAGAAFATFHEYPADNHLFVAGSGPPNPEEYEKPGHVDEDVVRDIAAWIHAR